MVFGYASNEPSELMPMPISLAHGLAKKLTQVRNEKTLKYLRPDGKTQVSVIYEEGHSAGVDASVISAQHNPDISQEQIRRDIINYE